MLFSTGDENLLAPASKPASGQLFFLCQFVIVILLHDEETAQQIIDQLMFRILRVVRKYPTFFFRGDCLDEEAIFEKLVCTKQVQSNRT